VAWVVLLSCANFVTAADGGNAAATPPPRWDAAAFRGMKAGDRVDFVKAALAWREGRLQNFSYDVTEVIRNVDAATRKPEEKKPVADRAFSVGRRGETYLVGGTANWGYAGDVPRRYWSRWDGAVSRTFTEGGNTNKAAGVIRPEQDDQISRIEYNQLLGWWVPGRIRVAHGAGFSQPLTLPESVDYFSRVQNDLDPLARLVEEGGRTLVELKEFSGFFTYTYRLDPERQFMPVALRSWYQNRGHGHGGRQVVTDARQVDGFWVPTRIVFTVKHVGNPSLEQERIYTIGRFALGDVKEGDLAVKFGTGTEVVDAVAKIAYVVGDGGRATGRPLADVKRGKAEVATEAELAEALAVNPLADDVGAAAIESRKRRVVELLARAEARRHVDDPVWGKAAPAFAGKATWHHSPPLTWEALRGKVVVVHFFGEWCGPCKNDYPLLANLGKNPSLPFALVGVHTAGSDPAAVARLFEECKFVHPLCVDVRADGEGDGWGRTFDAMGVSMVPQALLIDRAGKVVDRGSVSDVIEAAIELVAKETRK
jgi:thiol-disulfide isomerase/thioredoxin